MNAEIDAKPTRLQIFAEKLAQRQAERKERDRERKTIGKGVGWDR